MTSPSARTRVLDPLERFSEVVFGLIMVLSFTCAISVADAGRQDVHAMLIGAIGCNLAWGIIDAAFYLIACLSERGRHTMLLRRLQESNDAVQGRAIISDAMPAKIAEALQPADFKRIHTHLREVPAPDGRARLSGEDWRGATGVFLLVFLSTFPVVVPFIFMAEAHLALRISNAVAIVLLFVAGYKLAAFTGLRRIHTGLAMIAIGAAFVALTIALGG